MNEPERFVHEGVVVGTPTKRYWGVRISASRGGWLVRCECGAALHDGAYPVDVDALMNAHVTKEHSA